MSQSHPNRSRRPVPGSKKLGRPRLKAGHHERVNMTLPPDVLAALERYGRGNRSGAVTQLTRAEMSRRGELPPLASYTGYDAD